MTKVTNKDIKGAWFEHPEMTIPKGTRVTDVAADGCKLTAGWYFIDDLSWVPKWPDGTKMSGFLHDATYRGITVDARDVEDLAESKTKEVHEWMKSLDDDSKMRFAINWRRIPHTLFNIACKLRPADELQGVNWHEIHKSRDLGNWSHGGKVICG